MNDIVSMRKMREADAFWVAEDKGADGALRALPAEDTSGEAIEDFLFGGNPLV